MKKLLLPMLLFTNSSIMSVNADSEFRMPQDLAKVKRLLEADNPRCTALKIRGCAGLSPFTRTQCIAGITKSLKVNTTVQSLNLSDNMIDDRLVNSIVDMLSVNQTLQSLDLTNNHIGPEGAKTLAEALKGCSGERSGGSKATKRSRDCTTNLTSLNLSGNEINDEGVEALSEALKNNNKLKTLNLSNTNIGDKGAMALMEALISNRTLTSLDLSWNSIGFLGVTGVTDGGKVALVEALISNRTLTSLNLSHNKINDGGARALVRALKINKTLTIDLTCNEIGDEVTKELNKALEFINCLESLVFREWILDDAAEVKDVAEALKKNKTQTTLDLSDQYINDEGMKYLAEVLKTDTTLKSLRLNCCNAKRAGLGALAEALKTNRDLERIHLILGSHSDTVEETKKTVLEALKLNKKLTSLGLDCGSEYFNDIIEILRKNQNLQRLCLLYDNEPWVRKFGGWLERMAEEAGIIIKDNQIFRTTK